MQDIFFSSKQPPITIWMTGLSGSGKTTLSNDIYNHLVQTQKTYILDGDILRKGLCNDLGFSLQDRSENIRRTAHVARLMNEAGVNVIVALISPLRIDRAVARRIIGNDRFIETFIAANLTVCEGRDPKGLYRKARAGIIPEFTGISSPYEKPESPEIKVDTGILTMIEAKTFLIEKIKQLI